MKSLAGFMRNIGQQSLSQRFNTMSLLQEVSAREQRVCSGDAWVERRISNTSRYQGMSEEPRYSGPALLTSDVGLISPPAPIYTSQQQCEGGAQLT